MTSRRKPDPPAGGETLADAPRSTLLSDEAVMTLDTGEAAGADRTDPVRRATLKDGAVVDRYVILSHLGAGGMGTVYAAWDQKLGRRVALKLLHTGPFSTEKHALRLQREARALARVNHDHVVRVFDVGEWEGRPWITMELVEGQDIIAFITKRRPAREAIVRLFMDAGRGLAAAHAFGVVHRDVKGDNIFVGADGRARIGDFGIATVVGEPETGPPEAPVSLEALSEISLRRRVTAEGAVIGTPGFMAPEQLEGGVVDARCDQFSFCVALWQAVFDEDPFPANDSILARFERMQQGPATPKRRWPGLEQALARGLRFRSSDRYADMAALLAVLDDVLQRPRRRALAAAVAVVMVGLALSGVAFMRHDPCGLRAARAPLDAAVAAAPPLVRGAIAPWLDRWSSTALAVCQRDDIDDAARVARLACFEARRGDASALVGLVGAGTVSDDAGLQAALALPPPEACLDARHVGSTDVARMMALSSARMALLAGDAVTASTGAERVLAEVRTAVVPSLVADAALIAGQARMQQGAFGEAEGLLREAVAAAMAAGLAHVEATAWTSLVELLGDRLKRREEARALMPFMRAAVARFPDDVDLKTERLIAEAYMHNEAGEKVEGALRAGEAVALARTRTPVNPHALGRATNLQALLLTMSGEPGRAVEALQRGRDVIKTLLPETHMRFAPLHNSLGLARRRAGDLEGAAEAFRAAVAVVEAQPRPADHAAVHGVPLTNLAFLDLVRGDPLKATTTATRARALLVGALGEDAERVSWVDDVLALAAAAAGHLDDARAHAAAWARRYATRDPGGWMHTRAVVLDAALAVEQAPRRGPALAAARATLATLMPSSEAARASLAVGRAALALAAADVAAARRHIEEADVAHVDWHGAAEERELLAGLRTLVETGDASVVPGWHPAGRLVLSASSSTGPRR